jgi:hypothetical protein
MKDPKDKFRTLDDPMPKEELRVTAAGELRFVARWMLRTVAPERPNAWRRFWAWALTGCRWERIE